LLDPLAAAVVGIVAKAADELLAEGLDAPAAARFIGVSTSKWHDLVANGHAPEPVRLGSGNCPRWPRGELRAWLLNGAPPRVRWVAMRDAAIRRSA
jgi:predicted DNA-binding transcriptional regulator AlpA